VKIQVHIARFIQEITREKEFADIIAYQHYLPASDARFGPSLSLSPEISLLLHRLGLKKLYTHQVEALTFLQQGANVLVSTPTASGKSLIYNIAVLEEILRNPGAKALYLFPLKALEQDQLKVLQQGLMAMGYADRISAGIYDGDTTPYKRKKIRTNPPQILFSNPDMLHRSILAYHQSWEPF